MAKGSVSISVKGVPKLDRNLNALERDVFPDAATRAVNRVATTLRSRTAKSVAKFMGTKQKAVRDGTSIRKAKRGDHPEARIFIRGRPFNLIRFKARQIKKGVSAAPWGKRRHYVPGFIVSIKGTEVAMVRRKIGQKRVGRLPIEPLFGPGIADSANREEFVKERVDVIKERMPVELESQISYLVERRLR